MNYRQVIGLILVGLLWPAAAQPVDESESAASWIAKVQNTYRGLSSLKAQFSQKVSGGRFNAADSQPQKGNVTIQIPDKIRWEYQSPKKRLFIVNGERSAHIDYEDEHTASSKGDQGQEISALLTGRTEVGSRYSLRTIERDNKRLTIELVPRTKQKGSHAQRIVMTIDRARRLIVRLQLDDAFGYTNDLKFDRHVLNKKYTAKLFDIDAALGHIRKLKEAKLGSTPSGS